MTSSERWEALQTRWAQGERLSPAEEQERLAFATHDARARSELQMFAAVRARGVADDEPVSATLIEKVLAEVGGGPRLRLVAPGDQPARHSPVKAHAWRRLWPLVAACAAFAAALGSISLAPLTPPPPLVRALQATPLLLPELARTELVLSAGQVLIDGQAARVDRRTLVTGQVLATTAGRACLTIEPTIDVCLADHSQIRLEALLSSNLRVRVEMGLAVASLSRRSPGKSFALLAGDLSATAHGTIFAARHEPNQTEVMVVEGAVEVARGAGSPEPVAARSRLLMRSQNGASERAPLGQAEEERLLELRPMHGLWTGSAFGVLELDSKAAMTTQASIDGEAALPLPLLSLVNGGRHHLAWRDSAGHAQEAWIDVPAGETRRLEAPLSRPPPAPSGAVVDKASPAPLLEAARAEVAHGNPRAALALYERLRAAYPASTEAHTVLPTIGKLQLDLGDANHALRSFDAYLLNPGTLAPEALSGKIRALHTLGQRTPERQAIQQYLARYPKGLEAPRFQKRLAELAPP